jgi:CheY-like chemotaxis protein
VPIVAVVSDLFFDAKIAGTARAAGVAVEVVRTTADAGARLDHANGLIVDLNLPSGDALVLVRNAKGRRPALPVIAFLSHVQVELAREARAAGVDEVLAKSKFSEQLPEILRRLT